MEVGDVVKVLAPFDVIFPDQYSVDSIDDAGVCTICGDRQFDPIYLEKL